MNDKCLLNPMISGFLFVATHATAMPLRAPLSDRADVLPINAIDARRIGQVGVEDWLKADDIRRVLHPVPRRVAVSVPLAVDWRDAGTTESLPGGGRLWRIRIDAPGAEFLSFKFSKWDLPAGATVHFVSVSKRYFDGPYTRRHNKPNGRFGSPMIPGDSAVVELFLPAGADDVDLAIESVSYGFRKLVGLSSYPGREVGDGPSPGPTLGGGPFDCQRDINCPEGDPYQDVERAIAEGYDGVYTCSGQLINSARNDNRLLYITAAHCEWYLDAATMVYYWNYENSGCGTGDAMLVFSTGSTDLYHSTTSASDLDLLELDGTDLDEAFDVYFTGWSRHLGAPTRSASIGFPDAEPKQVSIDDDPSIDCAPNGCDGQSFGPNFWRIQDWEVGVTLAGSSGGGLLNQDQLLVGVLTGGIGTNCDNFVWDEFAKLSTEYSAIQPFLDPDATGIISLLGKDWMTIPSGDADGDGDVDLRDVQSLQECTTGPGAAEIPGNCETFDFDLDDDIDLADMGAFQAAYTGPCGIEIIEQPQSATVCAGDAVSLSVQSIEPDVSYQWQRDGRDIPGSVLSVLDIDAVFPSDVGFYRCVLTDHCDNEQVSEDARIDIAANAKITTPPAGGTICAGDSIFMFVLASNGVSFQWFKNEVPIDGATSVFFSIAAATSMDSGSYHVVVFGACNLVASEPAVIEINDCPK